MSEALKVLVLAVLLLAAAGIALAMEPHDLQRRLALNCVTGAEAENETDEGGEAAETFQAFATVEEAEAYLCADLPHPRDTAGWQFESVVAIRSHALADYKRGEFQSREGAYKIASFVYDHLSGRTYSLGYSIYPEGWFEGIGSQGTCQGVPRTAQEISVHIQGQDVTFFRDTGIEGDPFMAGCWEADGLRYFAAIEFWGEPDLQPEIVRLLESIE